MTKEQFEMENEQIISRMLKQIGAILADQRAYGATYANLQLFEAVADEALKSSAELASRLSPGDLANFFPDGYPTPETRAVSFVRQLEFLSHHKEGGMLQ